MQLSGSSSLYSTQIELLISQAILETNLHLKFLHPFLSLAWALARPQLSLSEVNDLPLSGKSNVILIDLSAAKQTHSEKGKLQSATGLRLHVLKAGQEFLFGGK